MVSCYVGMRIGMGIGIGIAMAADYICSGEHDVW